jgi:hypothetical protein
MKFKHHYIPQFYLKLFTNEKGNYYLFDKKYNKFKSDSQSPSTSFFEYNRNMIMYRNKETSLIEETYSSIESGFAQFIHYLLNNANRTEIMDNEDTIYMLKCYIALQFWRLPAHDFFVDEFIRHFDFKNARNKLMNNISKKNFFDYHETIENLNSDKDYRYYFRCFLLPFLLFNTFDHRSDVGKWRIYTAESNNYFSYLCSDIPIIYNSISDLFNFKNKIVFPLTKNKILVITDKKHPLSYPAIFSGNINLVLYEQSYRFLSALDKNYLKEIIELHNDMKKNGIDGILRNNLFQYI